MNNNDLANIVKMYNNVYLEKKTDKRDKKVAIVRRE